MATALECLRRHAGAHGCRHFAYQQSQPLARVGVTDAAEGANGICSGLSLAWLESNFSKMKTKQFINSALNINLGSMFWRAHDLWKTSTGLENENFAQPDLEPALKRSGETKKMAVDVNSGEELSGLVRWLSRTVHSRGFLLSTNGANTTHVMAAFGSMTGPFQFFDPNAGVVLSSTALSFYGCLKDYLGDDDIQAAYWPKPRSGGVGLYAEKYKYRASQLE